MLSKLYWLSAHILTTAPAFLAFARTSLWQVRPWFQQQKLLNLVNTFGNLASSSINAIILSCFTAIKSKAS